MLRFSQADLAMMLAMSIDPEKLARAVQPSNPNVGDGDLKKLAGLNMKEALNEYKNRVKLPNDDSKQVREFAQVLYEHNEAAVPGCMEKFEKSGLDSYQAQLWARGMSVRGQDASLIGSIFTTESRALFPEYIHRVMTQAPLVGLNYAVIEDLISARVTVNSGAAYSLNITDKSGPLMSPVAQRAELPRVKIDLNEDVARMQKYGCAFDFADEVQRRCSMQLLDICIQAKGIQFQKDLAVHAANKALDGATNGGTSASSGKITSKEFIKQVHGHWHKGYNVDVILYGETVDNALLDNAELWDPRTSQVLVTGKMPQLGGAVNKYVAETSDLGSTKLLYIEKMRNQVMFVEAGGEVSESDRFVLTQTEVYAYSLSMVLDILLPLAARKYAVKA